MNWSSRPDPRPRRPRTANRPDIRDDRPVGVLFSTQGSTGWGRVRNLGDYKKGKKEGDFSHLHDKFADPEDSA